MTFLNLPSTCFYTLSGTPSNTLFQKTIIKNFKNIKIFKFKLIEFFNPENILQASFMVQ